MPRLETGHDISIQASYWMGQLEMKMKLWRTCHLMDMREHVTPLRHYNVLCDWLSNVHHPRMWSPRSYLSPSLPCPDYLTPLSQFQFQVWQVLTQLQLSHTCLHRWKYWKHKSNVVIWICLHNIMNGDGGMAFRGPRGKPPSTWSPYNLNISFGPFFFMSLTPQNHVLTNTLTLFESISFFSIEFTSCISVT